MDVLQGVRQLTLRLGVAEPQAGLRKAELDQHSKKALLGTIVEIAFQPLTLGVARLDDPGQGGAQVIELGERFGSEAFIVDGKPGCRPDLALQVDALRGVCCVAN